MCSAAEKDDQEKPFAKGEPESPVTGGDPAGREGNRGSGSPKVVPTGARNSSSLIKVAIVTALIGAAGTVVAAIVVWFLPVIFPNLADRPGKTPDVVLPTVVASVDIPNPFKHVQSPKTWFERAQTYRRTDSDTPQHTKRPEWDPIVLRRRYFSADSEQDGPFGRGWHYSFESRIAVNRSTVGKIVYWDESGEFIEFKPMQPEKKYVELLKPYVPTVSSKTALNKVLKAEERKSDFLLSELSKEEKFRYIGIGLEVAELRFIGEHVQIRVPGPIYYFFHRDGRLHFIRKPSQPTIEIRYDPQNPKRVARVSVLTDKPHFIDFEYNSHEQVQMARYEDNTRYEYAYDDGRLVNVSVDGKTLISYGYDDGGRINRVEEAEASKPLIIRYSEKKRTELIRGSERIQWEFEDHPIRWSRVVTKRWRGDAEPHRVEFTFDKVDNSLTMKDANWEEPKVYYLSACGCKPLEVAQSGKKTLYTYNNLGLIKRIKSPDETIDVEHHPKFFKVTSVTKRGLNGVIREWYKSLFNARGERIEVTNHEGKLVTVEYDDQGHIAMVKGNWDDKEYYFSYNKGEPRGIHIQVPGLGVVMIERDYSGKVTRVDAEPDAEHGQQWISPTEILNPLQDVMKLVKALYDLIDTDFTKINAEL